MCHGRRGLALLEQLPRGFAGAGMLADRDGRLALVEIGRKRINVTERLSARSGGTAVNVNCWVGMQAAEGDPLCALDNPAVPNQSRYHRAKELLGGLSGPIDLSTMARLLSDHAHKDRFAGENPWIPGHGYSICNHGSLHGGGFDPRDPHGARSAPRSSIRPRACSGTPTAGRAAKRPSTVTSSCRSAPGAPSSVSG